MSDSFMVAARIPMSREGFEKWLSVPVPDADEAIENPGQMYTGWFWDGKSPDGDWDLEHEGETPRTLFADQVDQSRGAVILRHRDEALEA